MGWLFRRLLRLGASVALSALAAWVLRRVRGGGPARPYAAGAGGTSAEPSRRTAGTPETETAGEAPAGGEAADPADGRRYPPSGIYADEGPAAGGAGRDG